MHNTDAPTTDQTGAYFIPIPEAARRLGLSKWTLYDWIASGRLRTTPYGRRQLIAVDEVLRQAVMLAKGESRAAAASNGTARRAVPPDRHRPS